MRPKKRLGQHFLRHRSILDRIVAALELPPAALVLEVGPGEGTLTERLLAVGAQVSAIEKDPELLPALRARFPALRLAHGDALALDWRATAGAGPGDPLFVAGNIPYNITSPLLDKALEPPRPARIVFLVQKEVADRIVAPPGGSTYGALSIGVQAVATVERLFTVPAGAFHPPPQVDSAVIRLVPRVEPLVSDDRAAPFRRLVVGLFGYRRKQLLRGLRELTGWPAERLKPALEAARLDGTRRPETVPPEGFVRLLAALVDAGWGGG